MPDPVLVVVGLVLGAVFAWLVARAHFGARLASLDALVRELREQRTAREGEAAALRLRLEKESPTGIFTLILRKLPAGWRIIHDHTSS